MRKTAIKKLTLNRESLLCLDRFALRDVVGGVSKYCTNTTDCTDSCELSCGCFTRLC